MNNYNKETESSYLEYLDPNNLHGLTMSQKRPVNGFEWIKELSQFKEDFIKNDEDSNKGYFLEVDVEYPKKKILIFIVIYHFYLEGIKLKSVISLFVTFMTRKTTLFT